MSSTIFAFFVKPALLPESDSTFLLVITNEFFIPY